LRNFRIQNLEKFHVKEIGTKEVWLLKNPNAVWIQDIKKKKYQHAYLILV
jgi:hypothetical protein